MLTIVSAFLYLPLLIHAGPVPVVPPPPASPPAEATGESCMQVPLKFNKAAFDSDIRFQTRSFHDEYDDVSSNSSISKRSPTLEVPTNQVSLYKGKYLGITSIFLASVEIGEKGKEKAYELSISTQDNNLMLISQPCAEKNCESHMKARPEDAPLYTPPKDSLVGPGEAGLYSGTVHKDQVLLGKLRFHDFHVLAATKLDDILNAKKFDGHGFLGLSRSSQLNMLTYVSLDTYSAKAGDADQEIGLLNVGCLGRVKEKKLNWLPVLNPTEHDEWKVALPDQLLVKLSDSTADPGEAIVKTEKTTKGSLTFQSTAPVIGLDVSTASAFHGKLKGCQSHEAQKGRFYWICQCKQEFQLAVNYGKFTYSVPSKILLVSNGKGVCRTLVEGFNYEGDSKEWILGGPFIRGGYTAFDYKNGRVGLE